MFAYSNTLAQLRKNEQGNMAIMFALGAGITSLIIAASIDIAHLVSSKSKMQDALDSAALFVIQNEESDTVLEDAEGLFRTNFSAYSSVENVILDFDLSGDNVIATAEATKPLFFGEFLNRSTSRISASSTIEFAPNVQKLPCIMALNPSARPGINLNSGANIKTEDCEVHVHSTQNVAFSINSGVNWDVDRTCVAGSRIRNNSSISPNIETNCDVAPDPYAGEIPVPDSTSCDFYNNNYSATTITMTPGVYCGRSNFNNRNSRVTFEPGLYVIRGGGWNVNGGSWEGDGVTFYYADNSNINFNSSVTVDMSAPTSGEYKDIFMAEISGLSSSQLNFNNSDGFIFKGVLYLPSRRVTFNSGSTTDLREATFIADSFSFNNATIYLAGVDGAVTATGGSVTTAYIAE